MRDLGLLFILVLVTTVRLLRPSDVRSVVAESLMVKHQLQVLNRDRTRAPQLRPTDRIFFGLCAILMSPTRVFQSAIILKPATILRFHRALVKRQYRKLFTPKNRAAPGPKGPAPELIAAIIETKHRNPRFGYQRIAAQIARAFGIEIDKDTVRRVLTKHYQPEPGPGGQSWLTFLGHNKDSLWSLDLFRCESLLPKTHWVVVVMDQYTRRIIVRSLPLGYNDPLFRFRQWKANFRIFDVVEVKTVPYVPLSHPFVE